MLWAADEPDLRMLQQKAAQSRDMEGYVGVCKYLYQTEENPELLLLYADSIHQLATKSKKPEQLENIIFGQVREISSREISSRDMP